MGAHSGGDRRVRIGILTALEAELAPLEGALAHPSRRRRAGLLVRRGRLEGLDVALAAGGIGKVNAAAAATILHTVVGCRALVLAGVAGGVHPDLEVGDLLIATRVVDGDYGRATDEGRVLYRPGTAPLPQVEPGDPAFVLDPVLARSVRQQARGLALPPVSLRPSGAARVPAVHLGTLATTDAFVASEVARDRIERQTGALALEMEGAAVAAVAERFGLPWLIVRAVSDRAGTDSGLDFATFLGSAAAHAAALVRALLPAVDDAVTRSSPG